MFEVLLCLSWWYNFFEAGIKYFFMVQCDVSGRYTFTKRLLLLRVEETVFSLYCPKGEEINTWHETPFYMVSLSVQCTLPFCNQAFPTMEVAVPLGAMRGVPEDDNRMAEVVTHITQSTIGK